MTYQPSFQEIAKRYRDVDLENFLGTSIQALFKGCFQVHRKQFGKVSIFRNYGVDIWSKVLWIFHNILRMIRFWIDENL